MSIDKEVVAIAFALPRARGWGGGKPRAKLKCG
jgi:hypothetical protein